MVFLLMLLPVATMLSVATLVLGDSSEEEAKVGTENFEDTRNILDGLAADNGQYNFRLIYFWVTFSSIS